MPTFSTPEPISATIDLVVGDARITASDRADTVVDVRPSDAAHEPDVRAAEQTRVEYAAGRLLIKTAKPRALGLFGKPGSVDVVVDLPAGSNLSGDAGVAAFHCAGRLGECRVKTATGDLQFDQTAALDASTAAGAISAAHVVGHAEVRTGSGKVRLGEIEGTAVIKNSNGDTWVGQASGRLRVSADHGDIVVDHAHTDVTAATAMGEVRIGEVTRGVASLKTAYGEIEVGIPSGTAARLDVRTSFGRVHNHLAASDAPGAAEETLDVHAHTGFGDIVIRRSQPAGAPSRKEIA